MKSNEEKGIRLNKFLAHAGIASRRTCDTYIEKGLVKVNGKVIKQMGFKVFPNDKVSYMNKEVNAEEPVYILLNKPKGYITTTKDERGRKTVLHLLKNLNLKLKLKAPVRIYPIGRLDRNTTGILLLTNDGDLALKLTHPSSETPKVYKAILDKTLKDEDAEKIVNGTPLNDGMVYIDELAYIESNDGKTIGIEIHEGRNRVVRRLFEHYGYKVEKLDRMSFAGLTKKNVPRGKWRSLTKEEITQLKQYNKIIS